MEIEKRRIMENRFKIFESYLITHNFDTLLYRLILEHNDTYRDNCNIKGIEAHINNKLNLLFEYVMDKFNIIVVSELNVEFPNNIWEFNDFYFQIIWGQGVFYRIYNKNDMRLIFQI